MRIQSYLLCLLILLLASPVRAEFYTWTDGDGKQFYTNDKEKIPAEYRANARPMEVRDDRVSVSSPSATGGPQIKTPEHKDKHGRGEEYWHARAEKLRRQIREQEAKSGALDKQDRDEQQKSRKPSSKTRKKNAAARDKKRRAIERKIAALKHELDVELPEEARKADAYPGWLRE